ncbi:MAG TPA: GNAT family N-acetyltransferase, partial [Pseudonocardiaceae bacterium]|nr:GNAT family N-acetyltransferase [Pseudonocardiaceae bacterium]
MSTSIPGLTLDELTVADADAYYALLDLNRQHLSQRGDYQDEARATPEWTTAHLTQPAPDRFGIRLRNELVGRVDLVHAAPPRYGLGYWLSHDATGHGYATAACAAIIEHARTAYEATDIFAGVTHGNDPGIAVLRRLDFQPITRFDHYTRFHLPLRPSRSALTEAAGGLANVVAEFTDEIGGVPTLGELLEILAWSIPVNALPEPLPLRANLKGSKRYRSSAASRVGGLNDNVFEEARDTLRILLAATGTTVTPEVFADALRQVLNTGQVTTADVAGTDVDTITPDMRKKRPTKTAVGDLLAIPLGQGGHRLGVVLARNRFGTALGLFAGSSANRGLTAELRSAPGEFPVYTEESLVKNGSWPIVGHEENLLALFPADPEIYHKPGP